MEEAKGVQIRTTIATGGGKGIESRRTMLKTITDIGKTFLKVSRNDGGTGGKYQTFNQAFRTGDSPVMTVTTTATTISTEKREAIIGIGCRATLTATSGRTFWKVT